MYCSILRQAVKGKSRRIRPSGVYRKPKWRCSESGAYEICGEEIPREAKERWRLTLYESLKAEDGKIRRKQWHVGTFGYWDIIDDHYSKEAEEIFRQIRRRIREIFPEAGESECASLYGMVKEKFEPVRQSVLKDYQDTEECYYRLIQNLIEKKKKESDRKKSANPDQGFGPGGPEPHSPDIGPRTSPEDRDIALEIVEAGYKKIAAKYHPDTGGDKILMQRLNRIKERLIGLSESFLGNREQSKSRTT